MITDHGLVVSVLDLLKCVKLKRILNVHRFTSSNVKTTKSHRHNVKIQYSTAKVLILCHFVDVLLVKHAFFSSVFFLRIWFDG